MPQVLEKRCFVRSFTPRKTSFVTSIGLCIKIVYLPLFVFFFVFSCGNSDCLERECHVGRTSQCVNDQHIPQIIKDAQPLSQDKACILTHRDFGCHLHVFHVLHEEAEQEDDQDAHPVINPLRSLASVLK